MQNATALIAILVALWAVVESRRSAARARAAMATLVEVVGLMETLTDETRQAAASGQPAALPAPAEPARSQPGDLSAAGANEPQAGDGVRARIARLGAQGMSSTEICRMLSVSAREVALSLALEDHMRRVAG